MRDTITITILAALITLCALLYSSQTYAATTVLTGPEPVYTDCAKKFPRGIENADLREECINQQLGLLMDLLYMTRKEIQEHTIVLDIDEIKQLPAGSKIEITGTKKEIK